MGPCPRPERTVVSCSDVHIAVEYHITIKCALMGEMQLDGSQG